MHKSIAIAQGNAAPKVVPLTTARLTLVDSDREAAVGFQQTIQGPPACSVMERVSHVCKSNPSGLAGTFHEPIQAYVFAESDLD